MQQNPQRRLIVMSEESADAQALSSALISAGVQCVDREAPMLLLARNLLSNHFEGFNQDRLQFRQPWLLVHPHGDATWVGPLFVPGRTACWACLAHRLRENRWIPQDIEWSIPAQNRVLPWILRWLSGKALPRLQAGLLELGPETIKTHRLLRRPQCPACGQTGRAFNPRIRLRSHVRPAGMNRLHPPTFTIARLNPLVSEITGIIPYIEERKHNGSFPVWIGTHCCPLPLDRRNQPSRPAPQPVMGKGLTSGEAKAGCLAEAAERYSIQWQGDEPRIRAREADLGDSAISLQKLLLFSDRQQQLRESLNRRVGGFSWIPEQVNTEEIDWTPTWSLSERRVKYVPTAYCYLYYPARYCLADSNGCAAGNLIEEAVTQGFLELVERDAVGIWWANRLCRPRIVADGPLASICRAARIELRSKGRSLEILDLTSDLRIPTFTAVSATLDGRRILFGHGSHWNAELAWKRAVSELFQLVDGMGEGLGAPHGRLSMVETALRKWFRQARLPDLPYMRGKGLRRLSEFVELQPRDLRTEVELCVETARSSNLELLVLNMTRPDVRFPVVRVIVPGLRHCWGRYGSGRLYDVPVAMGWRTQPLSERDLNPVAYFL